MRRLCLPFFALVVSFIHSDIGEAATVAGLGTQKIGAGPVGVQWRDSTVVKTFDADGNNILGTAGYMLFKTNTSTNVSAADDTTQMTLSLPSWLTFAPATTTNFSQINYGYTQVQNPTAPTTSITMGASGYTWTLNPGASYPMFTFTMGANVPSNFTLTIAMNNIYVPAPTSLTLAQTAGSGTGSATLGSFPSSGYSDANFASFKITDAKAGDVFTLSGLSPGGGADGSVTMYVSGFMFDTGAPPVSTPPVSAPSVSTTFHNVPLGPLGFVDGMIERLTSPYDKYVRTDVGGAYKWTGTAWKCMTDTVAMQQNAGGVLSIALDPEQTNVLYLVANNAGSATNGGVYKSTDGGSTWKFVGPTVPVQPNANYRNIGERLAVDPNNSSIVYFGTQKSGLYKSTNAGATWSQVPTTSIPAGTAGYGISFVTFDARTASSGTTQIVYVGVIGAGVYRSDNGGTTWSPCKTQPGPSYEPNRSAILPNGTLFVTYQVDSTGDYSGWAYPTAGAVYKYVSGTGTALPTGGANQLPSGAGFCAITVDPKNADHLIAGTFQFQSGNRLYATTNGGSTWAQLSTPASSKPYSWWADYWFTTGFSGLIIDADPSVAPLTWATDGTSTWSTKTDTTLSTNTVWTSNSSGIEELVVQDVHKIPGGPLIVGTEDVIGFSNANPSQFPTSRWFGPSGFGNGTSVDFEESSPLNVVRVGGVTTNSPPGFGSYSADGGNSWTEFGSLPSGKLAGSIAASATDPSSFVWVPSANGGASTCYYTTNRGATWTQSTGAPVYNYINDFYGSQQPLASDRVNGSTFYLYGGYGTSPWGAFYRSTDGGKTFNQINSASPLPVAWENCLKAVPGKQGQIWLSIINANSGNGIYRSLDGGATWAQVPNVTEAAGFGFGANSPSTGQPILFLSGTINGTRGLYRCDNAINLTQSQLGTAAWQLLTSATNAVPASDTHSVEGDRQNAGVVYIGTPGRGVITNSP
jgi:xyloglucan-specific exo-beta-1,4-glucanase